MRTKRYLLFGAILACAVLGFVVPGGSLQAGEDRSEVERTARDYIEGWYTADSARMARALHPDLVKRRIETLQDGQQVVENVTRDDMIRMTSNGGGSKTPDDQRNMSIEVLDITGDIAAVKTLSSQYVDILSMAKINGKWVIVNVLWSFISPSGSAAPAKR
jgi:hypothetical protein